jgi:hypothetical protein
MTTSHQHRPAMDQTFKPAQAEADSKHTILPVRGRAQAIVEFGLVALLLCLLLFGVFDFGMLLNGWIAVTSAAREGARQGAVGIPLTCTAPSCTLSTDLTSIVHALRIPDADSPVSVSVIYCPSGVSACTSATQRDPSTLTIPYGPCDPATTTCAGPTTDDLITVSVAAPLQVVTPLVRPFFCGSAPGKCLRTVNSSATMRYEGAYVK